MRSTNPKELIDQFFDRLDTFYDQRLSRLEELSSRNSQSMLQIKTLINDLNLKFSELSLYLSPVPKIEPPKSHDFKSFFDKIVQESRKKGEETKKIANKPSENRSLSNGNKEKITKVEKRGKTPIIQKKNGEKGFKVIMKPNSKIKLAEYQKNMPLKDYKAPLKLAQRRGSEHSTDTTLQFKAENSEEVARTELPAKSEYSKLENEIL